MLIAWIRTSRKPGVYPVCQCPPCCLLPGRGHGRAGRRTIQMLPAPEGIWPYARQVFLIERYTCDLQGNLTSAVAALGLTALSDAQASPDR